MNAASLVGSHARRALENSEHGLTLWEAPSTGARDTLERVSLVSFVTGGVVRPAPSRSFILSDSHECAMRGGCFKNRLVSALLLRNGQVTRAAASSASIPSECCFLLMTKHKHEIGRKAKRTVNTYPEKQSTPEGRCLYTYVLRIVSPLRALSAVRPGA